MRLWLIMLVLALCAGCATRIELDAAVATAGEDAAGTRPLLNFQNRALSPRNGGQLVRTDVLQAGDILLSAANGVSSVGIRLATLAPVSHASLYIGEGEIVEAVGKGVRSRPVADALDEEAVIVVLRHPNLLPEHGAAIRRFAKENVGKPYDHLGIMLQAPFSLERRLCELPLLPEIVRNACLHGIARIQLGTPDNERFFCSQLVLEAYRQAGLPLTSADPRWVSPSDILHMREGDVAPLRIHQSLTYVGHLKFPDEAAVAQAD